MNKPSDIPGVKFQAGLPAGEPRPQYSMAILNAMAAVSAMHGKAVSHEFAEYFFSVKRAYHNIPCIASALESTI